MAYFEKDTRPIVSDYTLTGSYALPTGHTKVLIKGTDQLVLDVAYTSAETDSTLGLKVEFSNITNGEPGSGDWYQQVSTTTSDGISTVNLQEYNFTPGAAETNKFQIPIPASSKYVRISAIETFEGESGDFGTLTANLTLNARISEN